ncbi:MAG: MetQ/NlpA family ABC transporter substrate-binding protein [Campylobacter sp.]|nr:MetQ/NlpA family ABC transporter substrate-binding protein [Campylobacter sp.]
MIQKVLISFILSFVFAFANDDKTIVIGITPNPFKALVESNSKDFEDRGYKIKIVEFTDYILPNTALANKELDANLYQHKPFLEQFNKNHGTNLVAITPIIIAPMGIYSKKIKNLDELKFGSKIAIPNDPTNESRALELLEKTGLIKLNDKPLKTPLDIIENPKELKFVELKAAQLPRALEDTPLAIIPTNYALGAGLNPPKDGLFIETKDSPYAIVIAVRKGDENNEKTLIIKELLHSPKVKEFIEQKYQGSVIPTF